MEQEILDKIVYGLKVANDNILILNEKMEEMLELFSKNEEFAN